MTAATETRLIAEWPGLRLEQNGFIARLTLDSADGMNAIDAALHSSLLAALRTIGDLPDARVVVLASTGRMFSAGGDFAFMLQNNADPSAARRAMREGLDLLDAFYRIEIPIVVAMNGHAIGLGASLVVASDAVVTHARAKLSDPHVGIGLVAGDGGVLGWPQSLGMLRARRYLLTGDSITGEQAFAWGLATDLVEPEDVLSTAVGIAERIAALPPLAVQGTKRSLNHISRQRMAESAGYAGEQEIISMGTEDLAEAVAAFKEKRPGVYRGR